MMDKVNKIDIVDDEVNCLLHEHWYDNHNSELMSVLYNNSLIFQSMNHNKHISEYLAHEYRRN